MVWPGPFGRPLSPGRGHQKKYVVGCHQFEAPESGNGWSGLQRMRTWNMRIQACPTLTLASIPRISPGLGMARAKIIFLATLESENTRRVYVRHLDQFISLLDLQTIGEVEAGHLVAYRNYLILDGRGTPTHIQALNAVRSFLTWATMLEAIRLRVDQIKALLKIPKCTVINPYQTLNKAEILRLLAVAKARNPRDYAMMLVFLGAGLRVSEVVGLSCRDVREDGEGGAYLHVRAGKGKKDRLVPVPDAVPAAVQAYLVACKRRLGSTDPLFLAQDSRAAKRGIKPMETRSCGVRLRVLLEGAGVAKRISPHSLRHTFALACLRQGKNIIAVARLLGHSTVATTQRYVDHLDLMEIRGVVPGFLVGVE